jgi:putative transposase
MQAYIGWLKTYSKKYKVSVHAWVLMTNHVHILCTPSSVVVELAGHINKG